MQGKNFYGIFDRVAGQFHSYMFANSDGEAKRILLDICNDKNQIFVKYPLDFSVYKIYGYDGNSNILKNEPIFEFKDLVFANVKDDNFCVESCQQDLSNRK